MKTFEHLKARLVNNLSSPTSVVTLLASSKKSHDDQIVEKIRRDDIDGAVASLRSRYRSFKLRDYVVSFSRPSSSTSFIDVISYVFLLDLLLDRVFASASLSWRAQPVFWLKFLRDEHADDADFRSVLDVVTSWDTFQQAMFAFVTQIAQQHAISLAAFTFRDRQRPAAAMAAIFCRLHPEPHRQFVRMAHRIALVFCVHTGASAVADLIAQVVPGDAAES